MKQTAVVILVLLAAVLNGNAATATPDEARLLRQPDVSARHVAFVHANDVWIVDRDGGEARRLTTFPGAETSPHFSPDGKLVAFTGEYDGNVDVYVVPVEGGEPERLTWHPGGDEVRGWTRDGSAVLFASGRITVPRPQPRLWTVKLTGGLPTPLPLPRAADGDYSPDGARLAYQMVEPWETEWRNYRGGQCQPIRVIDLKSLAMTKAPWTDSNDLSPVWLGDEVFFLSDRDWAMNVWSWNPATGALVQRTHFKEFDCKQLGGGDGRLVFENGGFVWTMDATGGEPRKLTITLRGDFPWARPHWVDASQLIRTAAVSPTGKRALFEARGEIFSVPAEKGDVRNLSRDGAAADRAPAWSPDGKLVSWFSDRGGEYRLIIADQIGDDRREVSLKNPTFFYSPRWSPDSKHLSFTDTDRVVWIVEAASGKTTRVDDEGFSHPARYIDPVWSPDSKWLAYSRRLPNQFNAVMVYSLDSGKIHPISDGMSDAIAPAWDTSGKYLAFLASTDFGLNVGWLDMTSYNRPLNRSVYLAVLAKAEPSPLAPESDEEEVAEDEDEDDAKKDDKDKKDDEEKDATPPVVIDFDGLDQRIIALDVPAKRYESLAAGAEGVFFIGESDPDGPDVVLHRYDLGEREVKQVLEGVRDWTVSHDGSKLLYSTGGEAWFLADAAAPEAGEGKLDLGGMRLMVDPALEWKQIFREAWRHQRDYFYVENVHGLDLDWAYDTYAPWVEHVRHRADLTYVLDILGGETCVGHSFTGGGDEPDVERVPIGLLGCDLEIADGRYRITRIYDGENWNPELRAPLSGPGIDARTGDYLLAIDGVELKADTNIYSAFDRTANRQVVLTLNDSPKMKDARKVTILPVRSEVALRSRAWVEGNRRKVSELSDGKLAYVWVPDTGGGGYTSFTRDYFAQQDRKGAILDERFNHGGSIADYMVEIMSRKLLGYFNNPSGDRQPYTAPNAAIWGPKVLIVNEMAGSGGDMLPFMFKEMGIGTMVGTRTWGGLVGIWDVPALVDGGFMTSPRGGFYNVDGEWDVEGIGVAPDIEVEQVPTLMQDGGDPQLEAAVRAALAAMETESIEILPQPADPVRSRRPK